ncbi:MAG: hypothetical protein E7260_07680 [Lachnospiraceae bacterium]|nr:hypothetical protein [Lachnospiraceae bacterium]
MKGKDTAKMIVTLCLVGLVLVGLYYLLHKNEGDKEGKKNQTSTEAQLLLDKDYERNYPATVREVVNQFSRISKCLYNEKISDAELEALVIQMRLLCDEEFLEENPVLMHIESMKKEVSDAQKNNYQMVRYEVDKLSSAKEWTAGEEKFASIYVCVTMKNNTQIEKSYEEFLLREDEKERWKIVGWRLASEKDLSD